MKNCRVFFMITLVAILLCFAACSDYTPQSLTFSYKLEITDGFTTAIKIVEGDVKGGTYTYVIDDGEEKTVSDLSIPISKNCNVTITGKKTGYKTYTLPAISVTNALPSLYFDTVLSGESLKAIVKISPKTITATTYSYELYSAQGVRLASGTAVNNEINVKMNGKLKITASMVGYDSYTKTVEIDFIQVPKPVLHVEYNDLANTATVNLSERTDGVTYKFEGDVIEGDIVGVFTENRSVTVYAYKDNCKSNDYTIKIDKLNQSPMVCFYNGQFYVYKAGYASSAFSLTIEGDSKTYSFKNSDEFENYYVTDSKDGFVLSTVEKKVVCTNNNNDTSTTCYFVDYEFEPSANFTEGKSLVTVKFICKDADVRYAIDDFPSIYSFEQREVDIADPCKVFSMPVQIKDGKCWYGQVKVAIIDEVKWELNDDKLQSVKELFVEGGKCPLVVPNSLSLKSGVKTKTGYTRDVSEDTENNFWGVYYYGDQKSYTTLTDVVLTSITDVKNLSFSVKALWTPNTYTVRFNKILDMKKIGYVEGPEMDIQTFTYDKKERLSENTYTRVGYTFKDWYDPSTEQTYADKAEVQNLTATDQKCVELYAEWTGIQYDIDFYDDGKEYCFSSKMYTEGNYVEVAENVRKEKGYKPGYHVTSANKDGKTVTTKTSAGNESIIITFEPITYTIHFSSNSDGSVTGSMHDMTGVKFNEGQTTGKKLDANQFKRDGYSFAYWCQNPKGTGAQYSDKAEIPSFTIVQGDVITLYAIWTPNKYVIRFSTGSDLAEGKMANQEMTYDQDAYLKANTFTRTGYNFIYWSQDDRSTTYTDKEKVRNLTIVKDDTVTLTAKWGAIKYGITLHANTDKYPSSVGKNGSAKILFDGTSATDIVNPSISGEKEIYGFYADKDCTDKNRVLNADGSIAGDVEDYTKDGKWQRTQDTTLYAKWVEKKLV